MAKQRRKKKKAPRRELTAKERKIVGIAAKAAVDYLSANSVLFVSPSGQYYLALPLGGDANG